MASKENKKAREIGSGVPLPKESCSDRNCPFHGSVKVRGRTFIGHVISAKRSKTAKVGWERRYDLKKYERYERRRSQLHAHNPPCIDAKEGDMVKMIECRPLSKTKNFIIVEKTGKYIKITGIDEKEEEKADEAKKDNASAKEKIKEKNRKAAAE